ncbi:hypothetical protein BJX65DRAFT_315217 [Aspergillus insuetus]
MKIFGIGFSGFIGGNVASQLIAEGHSLTGLARSEASADSLRKLGVIPIKGSIADATIVHNAAKEADGAVLLSTGGFLKEAVGKGNDYNDCIEAILSAFEGTGKPFMQLGGIGLWMGRPEATQGVLDEKVPFSTSTYYAEMLPGFHAVQNSGSRGVRAFMLIPGQVYGRQGGHIGPLPRLFEDFRRNGAIHCLWPSSMSGIGTFTHIDDLGSAIVLGLQKAEAGKRYVVATDNCDRLSICRMVSRVCGLQGRLTFVDEPTMEKQCGWTGPLHFKLGLVASSAKIRDELGWKPEGRGVLDELQKLIDDKADVSIIYVERGHGQKLGKTE